MLAVRVFAAVQMPAHLLSAAADNIVYCPVVTRQHFRTEAINVIRSVAAEYIRQLDHCTLKVIHQSIDGFNGRGLCLFS